MIKTVGDCKELDEAIKRASFEIEKELLYMPYGNSKFFRFIPSLKFVKLSEDTENIGKNWKLVITIKSKDEHGIYKDCVEMYAINKGKMQCMAAIVRTEFVTAGNDTAFGKGEIGYRVV